MTRHVSNSIGRISADGKSLEPLTTGSDGAPFVGPNDFALDKRGGINRWLRQGRRAD
ncbi:MAG: hypothetical protein ACOH2H_24760 [Cypionkella sp.]